MLRIGLTGVIGCGKSRVAAMLHESQGIPVIDMDEAGRAAVERPAVLRRLAVAFGPAILTPAGALDRRALGRIVFADPAALRRLNAIVHPAMLAIVRRWMRTAVRQSAAPYLFVDTALLFELGFESELDRVVTVCAPAELCRERIMARDHLTRLEADQRLAAQLPQEEKCRRADYVVDNSGSLDALQKQAAALHVWLLEQNSSLHSFHF
ncbi:MAG TPA: dephospho-CoA kinase [bacterium]|nr:dephospho-CoA kinase [bacterium]HPR88714.1 dephospho-CoA kinase [bacterium]